jgi:acetolactate decarboxylase
MSLRISTARNDSRVYLCAPVNALVEGIYEENITLAEVMRHGDFGLGTFNDLDGEMVLLDGKVFQVTGFGCVGVMEPQTLTPFACVTFYQPHSEEDLDRELDYAGFQEWLTGLLPSPNVFYAIRLAGEFAYVKTRSVPKQDNYRPLVEVTREEPIFQFENIAGTLAGFYTPAFMSSLSVPGLHLHFLSHDLQHGGHLLECRPRNLHAGIQAIYTVELSLPRSLDYLTWDFSRDINRDLHEAEK